MLSDEQKKVVAQLVDLPRDKLDKLAAELAGLKLTTDTEGLIKSTSTILGVAEANAREILDFLVALYIGQEYPGKSRELAIEDVKSAVPPGKNPANAVTFLDGVLRLEKGFGPVSKALVLRLDNQKVVQQSRIITDLRPVFTPANTKPMGMLVQHTIRLTWLSNNEDGDVYVAASEEQLRRLRTAIERAIKKGEELQKTFAQVPFLKEKNDA